MLLIMMKRMTTPSLWLGQSIAVHHSGAKMQRICYSNSPIPNSEEPLFYLVSSVVSKISPATAGFINSDIIAESSIIISSAWSYYVRNNHKFGKCRIS